MGGAIICTVAHQAPDAIGVSSNHGDHPRRSIPGVTHMQPTNTTSTDQLMRDMRNVVSDTEDLLKATAGDVSEQAASARARAEESLRSARARIAEVQQDLVARARAAAQATDQYVHENPWPAVGAAAGIGFVIGLLISRR